MPLFSSRRPAPTGNGFAVDAANIHVLHDAKSFHQQLLLQIAQAQQRIHLCSLYLQHDEGGESILLALHQAKQQRPQLDIRVFVDFHRARRGLIGAGKQAGNAQWYQELCTRFGREQVPVYGVPVQTRELFGVLHLKGFVIDDWLIYSGASLNNVYLHVGERYRFDRYHLIQDRNLADSFSHYLCQQLLPSPGVQRLDVAGLPRPGNDDIKSLRQRLAGYDYLPAPAAAGNGRISVTPLSGVGKDNRFNQRIEQLLSSAQSRITLCTPYFNPPKSILRILQKQIRNGLQVEIIVGDKTANDFYIPPSEPFRVISALPYLYESNLRRFAKRNQNAMAQGRLQLRLWQHEHNSYHLKGIWVDKAWQLVTGNNLNPRAFRLDLENGLLLHDPTGQLRQQTAAELDNIRRHTRLLQHYRQLETLRDYPAAVKTLLSRLKRIRLDRLLNRLL
ncbi:CDP-diacylglycerol--serine O-phosphatidyltransferase [Vogesella indigofera]|uniref:CDP-diacylglycerol--serine O-phosphatidyltransferase n=1 Tax=Vogesella indigofera TaxID=45465 RepID=UPI00234ECE2B|nr:CDP-diacylglycerol--serine O-phosphatidyltransferase [Vogesella indigofera]MDC7708738.1 CDP-diacylglycerol--serine O-phosphatidyltransferase [Vogesella indigofera]